MSASTIDLLKKVKLFRGLNEEQLEKVCNIIRSANFSAGEAIAQENEPGDEMFILCEGRVQISKSLTMKTGKDSYADRHKTLNTLDAGDYPFFGEIALVEIGVRSASIVAETDCKLMVLKKENFDRLCEGEYEIGYRIIRNISEVICAMLRKSNNDVIKLATAFSIAMNR
ncbi:MAG: cyclic nucleotide-binding domain-containing protein [bacterium]